MLFACWRMLGGVLVKYARVPLAMLMMLKAFEIALEMEKTGSTIRGDADFDELCRWPYFLVWAHTCKYVSIAGVMDTCVQRKKSLTPLVKLHMVLLR